MQHAAVFPVVHLALNGRIGEVFHVGIGGNRSIRSFLFFHIGKFHFRDLTGDILHSCRQLFRQISPIQGNTGCFLPVAIHAVIPGHPAQHHFRMLRKVGVERNTILRDAQMHPIRLDVDRPFPLLQKQNIRCDLCARVGLEGVVGQTNRAQQLGATGNIAPHVGILLIHRPLAGNERNNAARAHLIQCLGEEIIVNREVQLVIWLVRYLIISEGNVANGQIVEIPAVCGFKARYGDVGLGIQLSGDSAGETVQLYAVQAASGHGVRQQAEKIAHAAGRFQNVAGSKSHASNGLIHGADDRRAGVMGVQGRGTGRSIFGLAEQLFEFLIFLFPICILRVKRLRKTAPAHIAGKNFLFFRRGGTVLRFQLLQSADGRQIPAIFGFGSALAQMVVGNVEVFSGRRRCLSCFLLGQRKFFFGQRIQQGLYRCVVLSRKSDFYVPVFLRKLSEINALGLHLGTKPFKVRLRNGSFQIGQSQYAGYDRLFFLINGAKERRSILP